MNSVQNIAAKAAELIRRHGWIQQRLGSCSDGFCLSGAIRFAVVGTRFQCQWTKDETDLIVRTMRHAFRQIGLGSLTRCKPAVWEKQGGNFGGAVIAWNDHETRSMDDVLAVLDAAADREEAT